MSSPTEDLHQRIHALGASRVLQILDAEQTRRARIEHKNELALIYHPHRLTISDSWELEIGDHVNHPPQATPVSDKTYTRGTGTKTIPLIRIDPDPADTQTWTKRSGPAFATINGTQLRINTGHSSATQGRHNITIRVTDGGGLYDEITVVINLLTANTAPVLRTVGNRTITLGQTIRINLIATDADNDDISYTKDRAEGTLNSETGVFIWTPTRVNTTGITIVFTASDGRGGTHARSSLMRINARPVITPTPPILDSIGNKARTGSGKVSFTVRAKDPDGLVINFSDGSNAGTFGTKTKQSDGKYRVSWTSGTLAIGTHTVTITATAVGGTPSNETDSETINIVVSANRPPVLRSIGNKTVRRGETLTFTISADDPENDTISYTKTGVGSLNSSTGVYSYSPNNSVTLGNKTVKFTATATGGSDSETITINVQAAPVVNASPPTWTRTPIDFEYDSSVAGLTRHSTTFFARDPNNLPITYTTSHGTIQSLNAGLYRVQFTAPAAGETINITIRATATGGNPANEYVEHTFSVTVEEIDYTPNITITNPIDGSTRVASSTRFPIGITATRHDGTAILQQDLTVSQTGQHANHFQFVPAADRWSLIYAQAGTTTITVSYTDTVSNRAYTTTKSVTVTVV